MTSECDLFSNIFAFNFIILQSGKRLFNNVEKMLFACLSYTYQSLSRSLFIYTIIVNRFLPELEAKNLDAK